MVVTYTYYNAIGSGVIVADDAALRDIDEALQSAEQSSDNIALALALRTKANASASGPRAAGTRIRTYSGEVREMGIDGRFHPSMVPVLRRAYGRSHDRAGRPWRSHAFTCRGLKSCTAVSYWRSPLGH